MTVIHRYSTRKTKCTSVLGISPKNVLYFHKCNKPKYKAGDEQNFPGSDLLDIKDLKKSRVLFSLPMTFFDALPSGLRFHWSSSLPLSWNRSPGSFTTQSARGGRVRERASERAQIRGSLLDFTAPFRVRGAAGACRDGMGWEGDARFPNCPKWPNFTAARQRRQCNRDHCHDDRNRSMKSRRVIIVKCILRIVSAVINPPHS